VVTGNKQTFEKVAQNDHQVQLLSEYHHVRRIELILHFISEIIKREGNKVIANVIDIGCGDGHFDKLIHKSFSNHVSLVAVDISTTRISRAKRALPNASFIVADIHHLPLKQFFDIAILAEVIEHLKAPELALEEVQMVLKKQGYLILDIPSKTNPVDKFLSHIGKEPSWGLRIDRTHVFFYDETTLKSLLSLCGFHTIEVRGDSFLRYDLLSLLGITSNKRMWWLPRFLDRIAETNPILKKMGAIQVFLCQSTNIGLCEDIMDSANLD